MKQIIVISVLLLINLSVFAQQKPAKKELYELREYQLKGGWPQAVFDNYFKNALIPVLNKYGVKNVGLFREISKSEPAKIYVLIPYPSMEEYATITAKVKEDADFITATQEYNNLVPDKVPYTRYTSSFLNAFDGLSQMIKPTGEQRLFEMRTYESSSEDAAQRKRKMFNDDELTIFYKTKLNPVFFGEVIAGDHQPCLTYMLTFKNMEERDANWKAFIADPDWKRVSQLPEYANTVSRIIRLFLEPLPYSQI